MNEKIQQFIEDTINLIEQNRWEELYRYSFPAGFTEILLESGINPLEQGLNYIPESYLEYSKIEKYKIPDNITSIGYSAFYGCAYLTNVIIPNSIESIINPI